MNNFWRLINVMVNELGCQGIYNDFHSHWVTYIFGLVLQPG